jgi:hypothetical protein
MTKALLTKLTTHGLRNVHPHDENFGKKFAMEKAANLNRPY